MALTKTQFINYIRCPRYCALEEIKDNGLEADISLVDYHKEERDATIREIFGSMFDDEDKSVVDIKDDQLAIMMPYYKKIEDLASQQVTKLLGGNINPLSDNQGQESFDYTEDGIRYLCYVDVYVDKGKTFDIVEVKATTSKKFLNLGPSKKEEDGTTNVMSIFTKKEDGIYYLKDELSGYDIEAEMPFNKYMENKQKLTDKYHSCGRYIYDLLVQRMIIEGYLKENNQSDKIDNIRYYLAVLNSEYVFDGTYDELGDPLYETDENGNDIIVLFDFTKITKELLTKVELDRQRIVSYLKEMDVKQCDLGIHCEHKKNTKCKFLEVCFYNVIPKKNSILNYIDNHHGFKDADGNKYGSYDLINSGMVKMLDINDDLLTRRNNILQKQAVVADSPYINSRKIKDGLKQLQYPLYHLDFETFPCPLPRLSQEKCYTQSVFQFSLHIEKEPGICDKDKDHYAFLAHSHDDLREKLVEQLCSYIDGKKGMIIVYNQSFEKARLKELADIFPEYRTKLLRLREMVFDLLYIIKNNKQLYKSLDYSNEEASEFNYYHPSFNGSFSIKKVLPVFAPGFDYANLEIANGNEALVSYANFPNLSSIEFNREYHNLLIYCKQDTLAMVIILDKLRKLVN